MLVVVALRVMTSSRGEKFLSSSSKLFSKLRAMMNAAEVFLGRIFCSMIFVRKTEIRVCVLGLGYRPSLQEREEKVVGKTVRKKVSLLGATFREKSDARAL